MSEKYKRVCLGEDRKLHKIEPYKDHCSGGVKIIDKKTHEHKLIQNYFWQYCQCDED